MSCHSFSTNRKKCISLLLFIGNLALLAVAALGLKAVSIFPPFDPNIQRDRRFDGTEASIFKESPPSFVSHRRSYCQSSFKDRFLLNVRCLIPRLKDRIGIKSNTISGGYGHGKIYHNTYKQIQLVYQCLRHY